MPSHKAISDPDSTMIGFSKEDSINHTSFHNLSAPNQDTFSSFPDLLRQNFHLTPAQDKSIGYTSMDSRSRILCIDEERDFIYKYFSTGILSDLNVVNELKEIREELLLQGYATETEQFSIEIYLERNDAKIIPGVELIVQRITHIGIRILETYLNEKIRQRFHNRAIAKASLCVGHEENKYISTIKINHITPSTTPKLIRILEDDEALYTIRINLDIVQNEQFPGRIYLPTFKEYCISEPFTALIYKRTIPFFEIQQSKSSSFHPPSGNTPGSGNQTGLIIEISPNQRLMNSSNSLGYPRSMPQPLTVFGTFQNYSEWLFRLAIVESIGRESRGHFIPADISFESIAKLYSYQISTTTFLPQISLANIILQYPDHNMNNWNTFAKRIKELHRKTTTSHHENNTSSKIILHPISWITQTTSSNIARTPDSNIVSSTAKQTASLQRTIISNSTRPNFNNTNTSSILSSKQSNALGKGTRYTSYPSKLSQEIEINVPRKDVHRGRRGHEADGNQASTLLQPSSTSGPTPSGLSSRERLPQPQPSAPLDHNEARDNTFTYSQKNSASDIRKTVVQESQTPSTKPSGDRTTGSDAESNDGMHDPAPIPLVCHPYDGYNFKPPEWDPLNGLTAVLNKQILNLFDIEKLREATGATYHDPIQPIADITDLQEQLNIHIQALEENHSTFNDYFHLVSRSAICSIIQQAPNLKKEVYTQIVKSDERQRLRFGLSTKSMEADIFWKDFFDRNALVCQMSLHVGTPILLAPGFYALVLTAGGNSPGSNSLVRSPLQPVMRNRIVEACLWHSRSHPTYMNELKSFWESSFAKFDSYSNESKIIKLPQNISPIIPSIGSCFPKHFTVLHEIITHTVNSLQSENRNEDIIWGRPYETDRLGCIREAGDSFRSLSKAKLDRRNCKSSEAGIVFKNILSIRTLFFGNLKKLQRWKKFTRQEEVEELVTTSSPFEEWYGQSRAYTQFQFPLTFQDFSTRLKSCWKVDWPLPLTSKVPDWSQVHSAASNADFAGGMIRSLVANDMSRLGWSMDPTPEDWSLLLNPSSSWAALNQLFPDSKKKFGPGHRFVDPSLAEVVTVSLLATLEPETQSFVGFDRIFVEHLLGRLSIFMREGWIHDQGKPLKTTSVPCSRKRKHT
ncbi:hypothetical protein BGAL_0840g00010 [Botrytis galanthina]|uniref:Uncharacterized protein n=1 Tax=Botrytis galanthina TaxID=278940 RepID=A0A4S8QT76_9HELO|nr:hypothetical protein BGAL_0840g00010 [Botrytis galanthina]